MTPDRTRELIAEAQAGSLQARNDIIEGNLDLVKKIVNQLQLGYQSHTFDDYVQEGAIGMMRAIEKFDLSLGTAFSTYAYWWVAEAIRDADRKRDKSIKLPRDWQKGAELPEGSPKAHSYVSKDDDGTWVHVIDLQEDEATTLDIIEEKKAIEWILMNKYRLLPEQLRSLNAYMGLDGEEPKTYQAVAEEQGKHRQTVQEQVKGALRRLKRAWEEQS